jgi:hypothetical protein
MYANAVPLRMLEPPISGKLSRYVTRFPVSAAPGTWKVHAYRTRFCDACPALKMGAFPREVRKAVVLMGNSFQISSGKCSECLQEKTVVRALAA